MPCQLSNDALDAFNQEDQFESKFRTLNLKEEVWGGRTNCVVAGDADTDTAEEERLSKVHSDYALAVGGEERRNLTISPIKAQDESGRCKDSRAPG